MPLQRKVRTHDRDPVKRGADQGERGLSGARHQDQKGGSRALLEDNLLNNLPGLGRIKGIIPASSLDLLHAVKQNFGGSGACGHRRAVSRVRGDKGCLQSNGHPCNDKYLPRKS